VWLSGLKNLLLTIHVVYLRGTGNSNGVLSALGDNFAFFVLFQIQLTLLSYIRITYKCYCHISPYICVSDSSVPDTVLYWHLWWHVNDAYQPRVWVLLTVQWMLLCFTDISDDMLVTLFRSRVCVLLTVRWMLLRFTDMSDDMLVTLFRSRVCVLLTVQW
jgi:hypothetical protein